MNKRMLTVVMLAVLALGAAAQAGVVETTVVTDADAYVQNKYGSDVNKNYGGSTALSVQRTSGVKKPYLHFDRSGLDAGLAVQEARLKMTLGWRNASYGQTLKVCAIMPEDEDWDPSTLPEGTGNGSDTPELDIVWNNAPKVGGTYTFADEGTATSSKVRNDSKVLPGATSCSGPYVGSTTSRQGSCRA